MHDVVMAVTALVPYAFLCHYFILHGMSCVPFTGVIVLHIASSKSYHTINRCMPYVGCFP